MKWCLFKKECPPEIYTPKAISKTLDAIQTKEDLLRFIHKKVSKGVYPKNHVLKGPYKYESSEYYIALYLTENAPKRYTEDNHWILWTIEKPESVIETSVLFKIDNDDTKTMIRRTSNSLTLEEAHNICCCNKPVHVVSGGDPIGGECPEEQDVNGDEGDDLDEDDVEDDVEDIEDDVEDIEDDGEDIEDDGEDIEDDGEDIEDDGEDDEEGGMDKKGTKKKKKAIKLKTETVSEKKKPLKDETIDLVMDVNNDDLDYESYDYEASFIPKH